MIELKSLTLAFGARKLFDDINVVINRGDRIGLVGANGAGKSTLLKILAGQFDYDAGEIAKPKYASVGYLPQEALVAGNRPLYDEVESSFENIIDLRREMAEAQEIVGNADTESPEYMDAVSAMADIAQRLQDAEESKLRPKVETVLHGLGFKSSDMQRPCAEFSGGWQMRIALAKLLLQEPSLLMLDEPTNHLDIESVAWLEDWLSEYSGAVMIVSHDRTFLNSLCNRTFYLWSGALESYSGNYDFFLEESVARRESVARAAANQARKIEKTEKFIERFRYKSSKAAQVQSRVKALEKIERIEVEKEDNSKIHFHFPEPARAGQVVLDIDKISKSFGDNQVLRDISFKIERGEKVALVGVNGAGKSTLAKIVAGTLSSDAGAVNLGYNVEMSYFAQHQTDELNRANDVLEEAMEAAPASRKTEVRGLLGAFLFSGDDVYKKVAVLSGGEKNRLALAKMLLREFNFLLLDEPTNHLDMNSKNVLKSAIQSYSGTCLVVSHDRDFIDGLVDRVIELSPRGVRFFSGGLSDYLEKIKAEGRIVLRSQAKKEKAQSAKSRRVAAAKSREELSRLKRELARIEREISETETDIANVELEMSSPEFFKKGAEQASSTENYNALKSKLEKLYADWEEAGEKLSMAENANAS